MSKHKDYIKDSNNSQIMMAYLDDHKLNPMDEKSYEKAYSNLKKTEKLRRPKNSTCTGSD